MPDVSDDSKETPDTLFGAVVVTVFFGIADGIASFFCLRFNTILIPESCTVLAILIVILHCLVHPHIGYGILAFIQFLTEEIDNVFMLDGKDRFHNWPSKRSIFWSAFWPVNMIVIPFYMTAIIIGKLYRHLWG